MPIPHDAVLELAAALRLESAPAPAQSDVAPDDGSAPDEAAARRPAPPRWYGTCLCADDAPATVLVAGEPETDAAGSTRIHFDPHAALGAGIRLHPSGGAFSQAAMPVVLTYARALPRPAASSGRHELRLVVRHAASIAQLRAAARACLAHATSGAAPAADRFEPSLQEARCGDAPALVVRAVLRGRRSRRPTAVRLRTVTPGGAGAGTAAAADTATAVLTADGTADDVRPHGFVAAVVAPCKMVLSPDRSAWTLRFDVLSLLLLASLPVVHHPTRVPLSAFAYADPGAVWARVADDRTLPPPPPSGPSECHVCGTPIVDDAAALRLTCGDRFHRACLQAACVLRERECPVCFVRLVS